MHTTAEIKEWIKANFKTRAAFAERVGVALGTLNNWLSGSSSIPKSKMELITLMMRGENCEHAPSLRAVGIALTEHEYVSAARAAEKNNTTLDQFARAAVLEKVQEVLKKHPPA